MTNNHKVATGYGLTLDQLSAKLKLPSILAEVFGDSMGDQFLTLAAFLSEGRHSSLCGLENFTTEILKGVDFASVITMNDAAHLLAYIDSESADYFYQIWNTEHHTAREILYDVTSFTVSFGRIRKSHLPYNYNQDDLPQRNIGLFCDQETGLPLFACSYDGTLNDPANFRYAMEQSTKHGAGAGAGVRKHKRRICIVSDLGYSREEHEWSHFLGHALITGISCELNDDARAAYRSWTRGLTEKDRSSAWMVEDSCYFSKDIPFRLGNVDGRLVMCRDMILEAEKKDQLNRIRERQQQELEETKSAPQENFEAWAASFRPMFAVRKSSDRKGFVFELDNEGLMDIYGLSGRVTLFALGDATKMPHQEIMALYRSKETAEDCFDTDLNGLSSLVTDGHYRDQSCSRLLIMFLALILRTAIRKRLEHYLREHSEMSLDAVISELETIRFRRSDNGWHPLEHLSATLREIMTALDLRLVEHATPEKCMLRPRIRKGRRSKITDPAPATDAASER